MRLLFNESLKCLLSFLIIFFLVDPSAVAQNTKARTSLKCSLIVSPDIVSCSGMAHTLTVGGAVSYTWEPVGDLTTNSESSITVSPVSTTTYKVKGVTTDGCVGSTEIKITVIPAMTIDAGNDISLPLGTNAILGASSSVKGGLAPYTYAWTPTTWLNSSSVEHPVVTPLGKATYFLVVTDANGCNSFDQVSVDVSGISYASLRKSMDAGFYQPIGNSLYFKYQEEYGDADNSLAYKIYDQPSNIVLSNATINLPVSHGENLYTLDISSLQTGIYTMEVLSEKNEKWYLKFKK